MENKCNQVCELDDSSLVCGIQVLSIAVKLHVEALCKVQYPGKVE